MSRYRILHVITSLHVGGAGRLLLRNLQAIQAHDLEHQVAYLVPRRDLLPEMRAAGLEPECLEHRRRSHGLRTILRLSRLVRRNRIDLIHTNLPLDHFYGGLAGCLTHRPVVATLHSAANPAQLRTVGGHRLSARMRMWLVRRIVDRFLAVSETARQVHTHCHGLPEDRVDVLPSGIPLEPFEDPSLPFAAQNLKRSLGLQPQNLVLLNVGRLHPFKGQSLLIRLMPEILRHWPTARLLIAGDGAEYQALDQAIREAALEQHVQLLGSRDDIPALLSLADLFLFPSRTEALGLALLEAMAAGKPVVASDISPFQTILDDGVTGRLASPADLDAWAGIIHELLADPEERARLGAAARRVVHRNWNIRYCVKTLESTYRQILTGSR